MALTPGTIFDVSPKGDRFLMLKNVELPESVARGLVLVHGAFEAVR